MPRLIPAIALLTTLALLTACSEPPPPQTTFGERVESPGLRIALGRLPADFALAVNEGTDLVLTSPGPNGDARAVFGVGEVEAGGINLVEAVKAKKAEFEAGGKYYGNRELGTPIGTAFTARGAWQQTDGEVEEIWVFAIHPLENRLLTLTFTYPSGESQERVNQLMDLFGEVEGLS